MIKATHPYCMEQKHTQFVATVAGHSQMFCYDCGIADDRHKSIQRMLNVMNLIPADTPDRDVHIVTAAWGHK